MEVNAFRGEGSVQGDDLQLSCQTSRLVLSRTLERSLRKIADDSEHKSTELVLSSKGTKRLMKVLPGFQLQGQGLHPDRSNKRRQITAIRSHNPTVQLRYCPVTKSCHFSVGYWMSSATSWKQNR